MSIYLWQNSDQFVEIMTMFPVLKRTAGQATARKASGGSVVIAGGEGSNTYQYDGGDGGFVQIFGGAAQGGYEQDDGGNVEIAGGSLFGRGYW